MIDLTAYRTRIGCFKFNIDRYGWGKKCTICSSSKNFSSDYIGGWMVLSRCFLIFFLSSLAIFILYFCLLL